MTFGLVGSCGEDTRITVLPHILFPGYVSFESLVFHLCSSESVELRFSSQKGRFDGCACFMGYAYVFQMIVQRETL